MQQVLQYPIRVTRDDSKRRKYTRAQVQMVVNLLQHTHQPITSVAQATGVNAQYVIFINKGYVRPEDYPE